MGNFKEVVVIIMKLFLLTFLIICFTFSCSYLNRKLGLEDDHIVEEILEKGIEEKTGLDVDLTPETAE